MLVSEILRIKGNTLFTTTPDGTVLDAVEVMAQQRHRLAGGDGPRHAGRDADVREVLAALAERGGAIGELRVSRHLRARPADRRRRTST